MATYKVTYTVTRTINEQTLTTTVTVEGDDHDNINLTAAGLKNLLHDVRAAAEDANQA